MAAAAGWPKAATERAARAMLARLKTPLQPLEGAEADGPLRGFFLAGGFRRWLEWSLVHPTRRLVPFVALAACLLPATADAQGVPTLSPNGRLASLSAESALLVDPEGKILFAKNAEDERAPASLVKLMTLYLAYEDLDRGKADLEEPVQVSHYAALTPKYRMGLRAGEWVPLR